MQFIDLAAQQARIRASLERRLRAVLDHGRYILGPEVEELEAQLAARCGVRHALAVGSGTDALLIALLALGVGPGDEVITTPLTFAATAGAPALLGARPRFVDIDPATWNLDPRGLEAAIGPRTRAIVPVDLFGRCADYAAIEAVAARHGLPVLADAAQSFGAAVGGRRAGSFGRIAATSFYPAKPLGAYGEGGAVFTDDDTLAAAMREIRVHGQRGPYDYARVGVNGRLDSMQCAVLLAKLEIFDDELARRQAIAARYARALEGRVRLPAPLAAGEVSAWAQFTIEVEERDAVRARLQAAGVPTQVYYPQPLHRQAPFLDAARPLPHAERACARVLSLPMHPYLAAADQDRVVAALAAACEAARP